MYHQASKRSDFERDHRRLMRVGPNGAVCGFGAIGTALLDMGPSLLSIGKCGSQPVTVLDGVVCNVSRGSKQCAGIFSPTFRGIGWRELGVSFHRIRLSRSVNRELRRRLSGTAFTARLWLPGGARLDPPNLCAQLGYSARLP